MKKIFAIPIVVILLLIVLASTTFASAAAGEKLVKGSFDATESQQVAPPFAFINATGVGNATHLGLFTYSLQAKLDLRNLHANTAATLIAANGDMIFGLGEGQGSPTGTPGIVSIIETYTITGGTGRFEGVTGNFTVERLIDRATLTSSGKINGTIMIP